MKRGNKKLFIDKTRLEEMIKLRRRGLSVYSLAALFSCDVTTIRYHLRKYCIIHPQEVYPIQRLVAKGLPLLIEEDKYKVVNGVKYIKEKSYSDYLKAANIPLVKRY
jgi:hypothetical protein